MDRAKSPQPAAAEEPETLPVIWIPPVDPGDAGGVRNGAERAIVPGTLHEAAEVTLTETNIQASVAR